MRLVFFFFFVGVFPFNTFGSDDSLECPQTLSVRANSPLADGAAGLAAVFNRLEIVKQQVRCHYKLHLTGSIKHCSGSANFIWVDLPAGSSAASGTYHSGPVHFKLIEQKGYERPHKLCQSSDTEFIAFNIPEGEICGLSSDAPTNYGFSNEISKVKCRKEAAVKTCTSGEIAKNPALCTTAIISILKSSEISNCDVKNFQLSKIIPISDKELAIIPSLLKIDEKELNQNRIYKIGTSFLFDKGELDEWQEFVTIGVDPKSLKLSHLCLFESGKFAKCEKIAKNKDRFILSCAGGDGEDSWTYKITVDPAAKTLKTSGL